MNIGIYMYIYIHIYTVEGYLKKTEHTHTYPVLNRSIYIYVYAFTDI